ncbi:TetR/AcrR family transcriptional regulator [Geomicrobium sediminis]|uniref:AcrR family transcriptional regulator n=1 Tax=Geomicrobium sediminis TaxID=1347788 RepID=A0ABS2PGN2_9BACL|nr:TetR/AcrR family transcriptional regulator [Geomicrobium sediminis]MBM7634246.1 AcrR family transcriptional regulator [Geomicrobium sediminis]
MNNITIKNITEKANVNRVTFYAHFDDKYQLFDDMIYKTICKDIYEKAGKLQELDRNHIEILYTSIHAFLNTIVENCPYSYIKLFPLLRIKMIDVLKMHSDSKTIETEMKMDSFRSIMISSMLYEAAEISILKKSNLSQKELLKQLNNFIF